ncbi:unnamed protein product, partial [Owenia fusiformis]
LELNTKMAFWKSLLNRRLCHIPGHYFSKRSLLSEAYLCNDAWLARLKSPALQKLDPNELVPKLHEKLDKEAQICPLDFDLLANRLHELEGTMLQYGESIITRYRKCYQARNVRPSTSHTIIRAYMEMQNIEKLLEILKDKINNGVFCDNYSGNMLMDHFIKQENWDDGLKIAAEFMLQEDIDHPSTWLLALYTCHMRRKFPLPPQEDAAVESDGEEVWVKVRYLTNPYYDDHFDIPHGDLLLGKTLAYLCRKSDDVITRSYQLIGWGLYEKFDKGLALLEKIINEENSSLLAREALDTFKASLEGVDVLKDGEERAKDLPPKPSEQEKQEFMERFQVLETKLQSSNKLTDDNLDNLVQNLVKTQLSEVESKDIDAITAMYKSWNHQREELLDRELTILKIKSTHLSIQKKVKELQEREELVTYFDREFEILMARGKVPIKQRIWETKYRKEEEEDDDTAGQKKKKTKWVDWWANYEAQQAKIVTPTGPPTTVFQDVQS